MDAAAAKSKYASKMQSVDWGNASSNWSGSKDRMKRGYTFGGKAKRNYDAAIDKATYRAPTSSDISRAIANFNDSVS